MSPYGDKMPLLVFLIMLLYNGCDYCLLIIVELCIPVTSNYKSKDILIMNEHILVDQLGRYYHKDSEQMIPTCDRNHVVMMTYHLEYALRVVLVKSSILIYQYLIKE